MFRSAGHFDHHSAGIVQHRLNKRHVNIMQARGGSFALLLVLLSQLFWNRSPDSQWHSRVRMARQRFNPAIAKMMAAGAVCFMLTGSYIYYNTNVLNTHYNQLDLQRLQAEYEQAYRGHRDTPQPDIDSVAVDVAIFPEQREAEITGTYMLTNYHDQAIGELHVSLLPDISIDNMRVEFIES